MDKVKARSLETGDIVYGYFLKDEVKSDWYVVKIREGELEKHKVDIESVSYSLDREDKEGNEVYDDSTVYLDIGEIDENSMFWGSNVGIFVREHDLDGVYAEPTEGYDSSFNVTFIKNGKGFTNADRYGDEVVSEEKDELFNEVTDGMSFVKYLIKRGAVVL